MDELLSSSAFYPISHISISHQPSTQFSFRQRKKDESAFGKKCPNNPTENYGTVKRKKDDDESCKPWNELVFQWRHFISQKMKIFFNVKRENEFINHHENVSLFGFGREGFTTNLMFGYHRRSCFGVANFFPGALRNCVMQNKFHYYENTLNSCLRSSPPKKTQPNINKFNTKLFNFFIRFSYWKFANQSKKLFLIFPNKRRNDEISRQWDFWGLLVSFVV